MMYLKDLTELVEDELTTDILRGLMADYSRLDLYDAKNLAEDTEALCTVAVCHDQLSQRMLQFGTSRLYRVLHAIKSCFYDFLEDQELGFDQEIVMQAFYEGQMKSKFKVLHDILDEMDAAV